ADGLGIGGDVAAEDTSGTFRERDQAAQRTDEGGLAGAVGAEQAEDLALGDSQRDTVHGGEGAQADGDPVHIDYRGSGLAIGGSTLSRGRGNLAEGHGALAGASAWLAPRRANLRAE